MSSRTKRGVKLMAGAIVFLAGAFPSNILEILEKSVRAAADNPFRAFLVAIGTGLILWAFSEDILDLAGVQTNRRLAGKIKDWLHSTFNYSLIETKIEKETFTIVTEFMGQRFTIERDKTRPILKISTKVGAPNETAKKVIEVSSGQDRKALSNDIVLELTRLSLRGMEIKYTDNVFEATLHCIVLIGDNLDEYKLLDGIGVAARGGLIVNAVVARWAAHRIKVIHPVGT